MDSRLTRKRLTGELSNRDSQRQRTDGEAGVTPYRDASEQTVLGEGLVNVALTGYGVVQSGRHFQAVDKPPNLTSTANNKLERMSEQERTAILGKVIRLLVFKGMKKEPIKMSALKEVIGPEYGTLARYFVHQASEYLKDVFGFDLVQPSTQHYGDKYRGSTEALLLINGISNEENLKYTNEACSPAERGLLMTVLSLIWCAPRKFLEEGTMWKKLQDLDPAFSVSEENGKWVVKEHPDFDNPAGIMRDFVSQLYLVRDRSQDVGEDGKYTYGYSFGPRALAEIGHKQIVSFLVQTQGKPVTDALLDDVDGSVENGE